MNFINLILCFIVVAFGLAIKIDKMTWLIITNDKAEVRNKRDQEKTCKYIGNFLLILGSIYGVSFLLSMIFDKATEVFIIIATVLFLAGAISGPIYMKKKQLLLKKEYKTIN